MVTTHECKLLGVFLHVIKTNKYSYIVYYCTEVNQKQREMRKTHTGWVAAWVVYRATDARSMPERSLDASTDLYISMTSF